jgi:3-oxoadipate enol-lactonase
MSTIHVHDQGSGTTVVWIHGFPLSSSVFELQLSIPGVRHVVPDLPGFGRSAPIPIERIEDYGTVVASLLRERGIESAVIAGVSMGGYVALSIVRDTPAVARALILIDSRELPDTDQGRASRFAQIERVDREGTRFLVDEMLPRMLTRETRERQDRRTDLVRQAMESASPEGVRAALRAMARRPDTSQALRDFDGPVLIAVGEHDDLTPPADARRMASIARSSSLVEIPGAAHLSNVEQPEAFNAAVRTFLGRIE